MLPMSQLNPRCFVGGWSVVGWLVGWLVAGQPILGPGIFARVLQMARYTLGVLWCIDKPEITNSKSSIQQKKQTKIWIQPSPVRRHRKGPSSHFRKSDLWMLQKLPTSFSASETFWWMKEWCQKHQNVYFLRLRACNDASSIIVRPHGILQYGRCS